VSVVVEAARGSSGRHPTPDAIRVMPLEFGKPQPGKNGNAGGIFCQGSRPQTLEPGKRRPWHIHCSAEPRMNSKNCRINHRRL